MIPVDRSLFKIHNESSLEYLHGSFPSNRTWPKVDVRTISRVPFSPPFASDKLQLVLAFDEDMHRLEVEKVSLIVKSEKARSIAGFFFFFLCPYLDKYVPIKRIVEILGAIPLVG
jgi:hypothetical protein